MSRFFLSLLTLSLSVSFALCFFHHKTVTGGYSLEEARQKISSSIRDRSLLSTLKYGPVKYTRHMEVDEDACSAHCVVKGGDGRCHGECYTRGCLYDFGDCPSRPYRSCHEMTCNPSRCDSDCYLNGCPSSCDLNGGYYKEFIFVYCPYLSPMRILDQFPIIESRIEEQTGLGLNLQMIYGLVDGEKHEPFANLWPLYPIRNTYNESVAIFEVVKGHVDPKDEESLEVLKRLGSDKYFAQVSPMILAAPQFEDFAPFAASYDDERAKKERMEDCGKTGHCY